MKILYFSEGYSPHDHRFLSAMAGTSHRVSFLMLREIPGFRPEGRLPPGVSFAGSLGYRGGSIPHGEMHRYLPAFRDVLREVQPDLLHAGPVQTCGYLGALAQVHPFLLMSWGYDLLGGSLDDVDWLQVTGFVLGHADWFLCDSDAVRSRLKSIVAYPDDRILQLPWGVDTGVFHPREGPSPLRSRLGWEDSFVILGTRMWEPVYGIMTLLSAFEGAYREDPSLRLLLLGDGSLSGEVRDFISGHGIAGVVCTPGVVPQEEVPSWYGAADAYIACSRVDGASVSLLQALACGLAVIATDIEGNREWIAPGSNGWLVPGGDTGGFSRAVLGVAGLTGRERSAMARLNREIAVRRADWNRNIRLLLDAYDGIGAMATGRGGKGKISP
ncbi:MAG: glycosyltransferase family 4 protein [Methanomicrobiales archaeon]|nr:glycosyltransferase family 4 protein [Methanomicrobiales archaeon]